MNIGLKRGYSIVELLMVTSISSVLILGVVRVFGNYTSLFVEQEAKSENRLRAVRALEVIRRDVLLCGSDPSPRLTSLWDSAGYCLGRVSSAYGAKRGVIPLDIDAVELLSYRPYDANGDGTVAFNEGLCTSITVGEDDTFTSSMEECYQDGVDVGSATSFIPLKAATRDNIVYYFADCDGDGVKDCVKEQNKGDFRLTSDDATASTLVEEISSFLVYYTLEDGRLVYYDASSDAFSDGTDNDIDFSTKDEIVSVRVDMQVSEGGKTQTFSFIQRVSVDI